MAQRGLTLLTDLYELIMMQGYFKEKDADETVIFDAFYRSNPDNSGHSICAELEQVIECVKNLYFDKENVDYLWTIGLFGKSFLDYLHHFKFIGDIYAIPEDTVIFLREPLVKVIAPIMEAQLTETAILNTINRQSLIVTKIARVVYTAQGDRVMKFGLRRTQEPDASIYGARAAMTVGCIDTSNVLAGQMFDVPIKDTHIHSWIMSFPDGPTASRVYARLYPSACILLVDTYDTLKSDVPNAIKVFNEIWEAGIPLIFYGIRLDSGDLAYLSKKTEKMLDAARFPDAVISTSNDLDENLISGLKPQDVTINSWGAGTNLTTSKDHLSFGGVYELAAMKDEKIGESTLKTKLSKNAEEIINPSNKTIQRIYNKGTGKIITDLIYLMDETYNSKDPLSSSDPVETWKKTRLAPDSYTLRELMILMFKDDICIYESPKVTELQAYCKSELATPQEESLRLEYPYRIHVDLSQPLWNMKNQLLGSYHLQG